MSMTGDVFEGYRLVSLQTVLSSGLSGVLLGLDSGNAFLAEISPKRRLFVSVGPIGGHRMWLCHVLAVVIWIAQLPGSSTHPSFVITESLLGRYSEAALIPYYSRNVHPLVFTSIHDAWLIQLLLFLRLPMMLFLVLLFLYTNCLSIIRRSITFFSIFIHADVTCGFLFHSVC